MKYCERHWTQLREAVDRHGMGHLVTASGTQLFTDTVAELRGGDAAPFDPLMACHNRVLERALNYFGLGLLALDDEGNDKCPVCLILTVPDDRGRDIEALERHYSDELAASCADYCVEAGLIAQRGTA